MKKPTYKNQDKVMKLVSEFHEKIQPLFEEMQSNHEEDQSVFDSRSEAWKNGEKGEEELERLATLEEIIRSTEQIIFDLGTLKDACESFQNLAPEGAFN